ncbi:MAG: hypothetical protein R8J85_00980 [Mariprofundales bacterium]
MDTIPVAPVGSVVAPTAIADHGAQQRRKQDERGRNHESDEAATEDENDSHDPHEQKVASEVQRDEEGHIDCYG